MIERYFKGRERTLEGCRDGFSEEEEAILLRREDSILEPREQARGVRDF